jgi:hypothetical protein
MSPHHRVIAAPMPPYCEALQPNKRWGQILETDRSQKQFLHIQENVQTIGSNVLDDLEFPWLVSSGTAKAHTRCYRPN